MMIFGITFFVMMIFSLVGVRKSIGKIDEKDFLSVNQTNWLKGIAVAWIAFSHYYSYIGTFFLCSYIGTCGVGIFFLCSGYGLTVSKMKKKNYHKGFLKNKLTRVYAPFTVAFLLNWLMVLLIPIECTDNFFLGFITISLPNNITWYLKVQVIMYIVYYVLMLICRENNKMFLGSMVALSVIFMIIGYCTGITSFWYQNTLWFAIGIFIAMYKTVLFNFLKKYFIFVFSMFFLVFVGGFALLYFIGGKVIYDIIMLNAALVCIVLICSKISGDSKVVRFLGKYSIEIFFSHITVLTIAKSCLPMNNLIGAFAYILASILVAIPIKFLANKILAITDKIIGK